MPLLKGVIDPRSLSVIYGPSGSGKTAFAFDVAGRIAAGAPWRGRSGLSGLVVYVAAEAGRSILRRAVGWRETVLGEARHRIPLAIVTRAVNLLEASEVLGLIKDIRELALETLPSGNLPTLVIFDTLARCMFGGDENSTQDMNAIVAAADRIREELRCAVVFVHHSGKDSTRGMRGSSALFAACDSVIHVADHCATVEKSRDGTAGEQFPFTLESAELGHDADGEPVTTAVIKHRDAPSHRPQPKLSGVAQIALHALREALSEHGQAMSDTSSIPSGIRAVKLDEWRERFRLRYGSEPGAEERGKSALSMAFRRAREQLIAARVVGVSDPYVWIW